MSGDSDESTIIKGEPREPVLFSIPSDGENLGKSDFAKRRLAGNREDIEMGNIPPPPAVSDDIRSHQYEEYDSATNILYEPETAMKNGHAMVDKMQEGVKTLELSSLRKGVWCREIESLRSQRLPSKLIAIYGATGVGKSSVINAVLDDTIVPTSGMRACTAVVTKIGYHTKKTIEADIYFLSTDEWIQELRVLLRDLVEDNSRKPKCSADLKGDASIAWQKVHAVYPNIPLEQLFNMSVDNIISSDTGISKILGTTKTIEAINSKRFIPEILKYIDSKGKKRVKKGKNPQADADAALWPLIRQVDVRCSSGALSSGAVLVDLPGVADSNAARNNIAQLYMKKCDCFWILAPITRAVDDKTAKDLLGEAFKMQLINGKYNAQTITFIASKCDDISCSEVIPALHLDDDPELEDIETQIDECTSKMADLKMRKSDAESLLQNINAQVIGGYYTNGEMCLEKDGFDLAADSPEEINGKKRKYHRAAKKSPKKRKNDEGEAANGDTDTESGRSDSDSDESESGSGSDGVDEEPESLTKKVDKVKQVIKNIEEQCAEVQKDRSRMQREKNAFCSLKRSEFSRDVLKEDFRLGLKERAEGGNPDETFDHSVDTQYDMIDLPVFTCSARDYARLTGLVEGDGDPTCFSNVHDTGIPQLQKWCHRLTLDSRECAARSFLTDLETFATSIQTYIQGVGAVTAADRYALRLKWGSSTVTARLVKDFGEVVRQCVEELQGKFKDGLEDKCKIAAAMAAEVAVNTSDTFADSIHWLTYRATLHRHGSWRRDLNVELVAPFTRNIAASWCKVFETDLFASFDAAAAGVINKVARDVEDSAPPGLKDRVKIQTEECLRSAKQTMWKTINVVEGTLTSEQKMISRCLAPHVQNQLMDGYDKAAKEMGQGSVARRKRLFHDYVDGCKDSMFEDGAIVMLKRLSNAAEAIGCALKEALEGLAQQIEVNLAVLWENPQDDPTQRRARNEVKGSVSDILHQIQLWKQADEMRIEADNPID